MERAVLAGTTLIVQDLECNGGMMDVNIFGTFH